MWGGVILHELGIQFDTPTINLFFEAHDFIKFVYNLKKYLSYELIEVESKSNYPIAKCNDLIIHMVHYKSFLEGKKKWEERISRIHYNNIFFIMVDRDGCTYEDIVSFDNLPYKNKVFLTYRERPEIRSAIYIPNTEENGKIRDICQYKSKYTGKRWLDDFDYVSFLNSDL